MAVRKLSTSAADAGLTLAAFIAVRLGIDGAAAEALVARGAVYLDRRRVADPSVRLTSGQKVAVHEAPDGDASGAVGEGSAASATCVMTTAPTIVHVDDDVVAIDKPSGWPSQATREQSSVSAERWVVTRFPDARVMHRLDRGASGLLVFARSDAARRTLTRTLGEGGAVRTYRAVVWGHPPLDRGACLLPIGPDPRDRRRMTVGLGRPARTRYVVVRRGRLGDEPTALLEVEIETGRTHQIRVHLGHLGHPVVGDPVYGPGAPSMPVPRLALHAVRLSWPGGPALEAPPPPLFDELCG